VAAVVCGVVLGPDPAGRRGLVERVEQGELRAHGQEAFPFERVVEGLRVLHAQGPRDGAASGHGAASGRPANHTTLAPVPTQKERNAETRRRLLSAAREVFAEKGYPHAGVTDIVKRAGRAHGSFYLHFANKEAVLHALLEDAMARLSLESRALWRWERSATGVRESVRRFIEAYGEDRDLWLLLDQRSSLEPSFRKLSDQWFHQLAASITHGMASAGTPALMPGLDPEVLAQVLAAMLSDSTRSFYQDDRGWTLDDMADEIATIWSRTLGYDLTSSSITDTAQQRRDTL
jgi:AcrR family transcriptional regulator